MSATITHREAMVNGKCRSRDSLGTDGTMRGMPTSIPNTAIPIGTSED